LGKAHPLAGEGIDVRRGDFTAVASEVGVAHVIDHDEDDVGALGSAGRRPKPAAQQGGKDGFHIIYH